MRFLKFRIRVKVLFLGICFLMLVKAKAGSGGEISTQNNYAKESSNAYKSYSKAKGDWRVRLGGIALYKPEYEGSDIYEIVGFPWFDLRYKDNFFIEFRKGIGFYLINNDWLEASISANYAFGRDEDDSEDLKGLGDIDGGLSTNATSQLKYNNFFLRSQLSKQLTGEDTSVELDLGLGYNYRPLKFILIRPSVSLNLASEKNVNKFFGINKTQALRSGLDAFTAKDKLKSVSANLLIICPLSKNIAIQSIFSYKKLLGDPADSPITKDKNQIIFGAGLAYLF